MHELDRQYDEAAAAIRSKCACVDDDALDCFARRNRPQRGEDVADFASWDIPEECQCSCHEQLRDLEEDVYGPYEY